MDGRRINIQDNVVTTTRTIKSFQIRTIRVELFRNANIEVACLDEYDRPVDHKTISLTTEEYSAWGLDDEYIVTLVCTKLGFTRS